MKSLPLSVEIQDAAHQAAHPTAAAAPYPATGTVPQSPSQQPTQPSPIPYRSVQQYPATPTASDPSPRKARVARLPSHQPTHPPPIAYNFTPQREEDQP